MPNPADDADAFPEEVPYRRLLDKLCEASVAKHYDPYLDIDWDAPSYRIDTTDPAWELTPEDGLGGTSWYRAQPPEKRARIGLTLVAELMRVGVHFENVLSQGLLRFTTTLDANSAAFRYCYHELVEEAQHSLMFQEFVRRASVPTPDAAALANRAALRIAPLGHSAPEIFFLFVLVGETLLDARQRDELLRKQTSSHPLLRRILQIHVTEEARHLSFARAYLEHNVPRLSRGRRIQLTLAAPRIFRRLRSRVEQPSASLTRTFGIPEEVARAARANPAQREATAAHLSPVTRLCEELGVWEPRWSVIEGYLSRLRDD